MKLQYGIAVACGISVVVVVGLGASRGSQRVSARRPELTPSTVIRLARAERTHPTVKIPPGARVRRYQYSLAPQYPHLEALVGGSDVVVVGSVAGVLGAGTTPPNTLPGSEEWMCNWTEYHIEVERYLRGAGVVREEGETEAPKLLKLRLTGGLVGDVFDVGPSPHPEVGGRYLFFLRAARRNPSVRKVGYLTFQDDKGVYRDGDGTEMFLVQAVQGQVRLVDGWTTDVTDSEHPAATPWQFELADRWPQIVGVSEASAIAGVREAAAFPRPVYPPHPD